MYLLARHAGWRCRWRWRSPTHLARRGCPRSGDASTGRKEKNRIHTVARTQSYKHIHNFAFRPTPQPFSASPPVLLLSKRSTRSTLLLLIDSLRRAVRAAAALETSLTQRIRARTHKPPHAPFSPPPPSCLPRPTFPFLFDVCSICTEGMDHSLVVACLPSDACAAAAQQETAISTQRCCFC